jgi:glycerol-3-phosphate cytidylyltransferase
MIKAKKKFERGITAGSFDLIHPGYIRMFREAKEVCEILIVALQDDPTLDRPQKCKPVQTWEEREEILSSLKFVDEIVRYSTEKELFDLLKSFKYDVRILGADYYGKPFNGDSLEKPVYFCRRDHEYSLTDLKKKIFDSMKASESKK